MESTGTKQARERAVNPAAHAQTAARSVDTATEHHAIGYGMPCAKCRAYYPADMNVCPICKSKERVSPTATKQQPNAAAISQAEEAKRLAEERDRLRELKSQIYASQTQVPGATTFRCALDQNHDNSVEPAAVCHTCYGELRQQVERMEAALHMNVQEAGKLVYDAVWADTSDPNKTYWNAADALLIELRKRAGIGLNLGGDSPLAH